VTIVETRDGRLRGAAEADLLCFRGIPYARAPVGERRWRPPAPPEPWPGVRDALRSGKAAPQQPSLLARLLGLADSETSEDCLYLDVWAPAPLAGRRPVLVWLHGGGFTFGSGSWPVFDGGLLARRGDAVVVTLNYRLGALGYLPVAGAPEDGAAGVGNFGLLDQIAALEWVRDNAAAFGGDPDRVTLFGESAGAMSIGALLGAPRAGGLFQRAILQSGAAANVHDPESGRRVLAAFLEELGMASPDLARLRALSADEVLAAQLRCGERLRGTVDGLLFQPVVDGVVLPRPPLAAVREGAGARVPLLVGTNRDEWKLFGLADPKARQLDAAGLLRRLERGLPGRAADGRSLAELVVETYTQARRGREPIDPAELWFAIQTDRWFRHPALALAEAHAGAGGDAFAYLFDWKSPALGGVLGSCHALEVPFVFGRLAGPVARFVGEGPGVAELSGAMQDAWLAFARSGVAPWPGYAGDRRATQLFGERRSVVDAPDEQERSFWEAL
jgi:para-nitrobenzyl esterase